METITGIIAMLLQLMLRILELFIAFLIQALSVVLDFARSLVGTVL